ncbi:MAG: hypothetical protein EGP96_20835, partial [Roseburia inulinivorans]|nr:hypothetical protein [Roseburia inulinivorans]
LTKNPQQLCYFLCQTLTKDPQQLWQTLNNFDYPSNFMRAMVSEIYFLQTSYKIRKSEYVKEFVCII